MTIGAFDYSVTTSGTNPDFVALNDCKAAVCNTLSLDPEQIEISMGMSSDFEHAVSGDRIA